MKVQHVLKWKVSVNILRKNVKCETKGTKENEKKSSSSSLWNHLFLILEPSSLDEPVCLYPKINVLVHIPHPLSIHPTYVMRSLNVDQNCVYAI